MSYATFYLFEMMFGKHEQCKAAKLQSSTNQCNDGKSKKMNLFFGEPQFHFVDKI